MKKNTIILLVVTAAVAGGAAWLFGTEKGRKTLGDIKDNFDDAGGKIKSGFDTAKNATSDIFEKGKHFMQIKSNGVKHPIV